MARAYATLANGGRRVGGSLFGNNPRAILAVNGKENRLVERQVLAGSNAALVTSLLEKVVSVGTGRRAALPDGRPVAGKTGTTENYGDAWFVGYTPQLAAAVWVGYPHALKPMLTEFHGDPVAGGTYPALVWRSFMEQALPYLEAEPEPFAAPSVPYAVPRRLVLRDGRWQLDNGLCRRTIVVLYFAGRGPGRTADCKPNEVEVPRVIGYTYDEARARLALQPLTPAVVYKPAVPGQRLGVVVGQIPRVGARLSSFDRVTLVFARPLHGVVPRVVGLTPVQARQRLASLRLRPVVRGGSGGRVVAQRPLPGVAAAPGMDPGHRGSGSSAQATRGPP